MAKRKSLSKRLRFEPVTFVEQFGIETVMGWIDIAAMKVGLTSYNPDYQMIRYICGIRRNVIAEARESDAGGKQGQ